MKDKKFLYLTMVGFIVGMFYSLIALFQKSAFSLVPGAISSAEKSFWIWITAGNVCFLGFIISLYLAGAKEETTKSK